MIGLSRLGYPRVLILAWVLAAPALGGQSPPDFQQHVLPILRTHCLTCHGGAKKKGGLELGSRSSLIRGGETGPAIVAGSADRSLLIQKIASGEMPPKEKERLTTDAVATLKAWINGGAPGPDDDAHSDASAKISPEAAKHWAFQRLSRPGVPKVRNAGQWQSPIDAFVLSKLRERGLEPMPEGDKSTLVRRAYLDLVGLPPSVQELETFICDDRADAYERLIDRLLASAHFGERWGRHWLDEGGYVDVTSTDNDANIIHLAENKWRYRDYVIQSFNKDIPFDRFLTEQLAGDELIDWRATGTFTSDIREKLIATGFLRCSSDDTIANELNTPFIRHGVLQRTGEIVVNNLLALTFNCAKCHDHKYEPISQRDYYRMLAIFQPAFNPENWLQPQQRQLPDISAAEKKEAERINTDIDQQISELRKRTADRKRPFELNLFEKKLSDIPEPIRADVRVAVQTAAKKRNEIQIYLAGKFEGQLKVKPEQITGALPDADRNEVKKADQQIAELTGKKRTWTHLQVTYDVGPAPASHLLRRGNNETPGEEVQPGFLSILENDDSLILATRAVGNSSGRRLALARWLTDRNGRAGSLVLRVRVNRVWQHLFGKGIIETSDNFGVTGSRPTHPELLEWLASEFVENGMHLKPLVRQIMLSGVYRQASSVTRHGPIDPRRVDPDNQLLWHMQLRRLEAEAIRDSILMVSGKLDVSAGGAPIPVEPRPDGTFVVPNQELATPTSQWRRSLYLLSRRNYHPTLLGVFDQPNMSTNCTRRTSSAVVLQSLTMLNDRFVMEQAAILAERIIRGQTGPSQETQIQLAFQTVLSRNASSREMSWCANLLDEQSALLSAQKIPRKEAAIGALVHLCHMLLNSSEFLYVP